MFPWWLHARQDGLFAITLHGICWVWFIDVGIKFSWNIYVIIRLYITDTDKRNLYVYHHETIKIVMISQCTYIYMPAPPKVKCIKFEFSMHFWSMNGRNGPKFCMLIYPDHHHNWLHRIMGELFFCRGLLIFLILGQFLLLKQVKFWQLDSIPVSDWWQVVGRAEVFCPHL